MEFLRSGRRWKKCNQGASNFTIEYNEKIFKYFSK